MLKMEERGRELVAPGASVTANCLPCLDYHVAAAAKLDRRSATLTDAESAPSAAAADGCCA